MAEVKPARDIFKKPRAEPDRSSQKPSLPFFFPHSCHTQVTPKFLLAPRGKCSSCTSKKNARNKELQKKRADSSSLCCSGACKVSEILRLSLDGEEMSISSSSLIFHLNLSPHFATPVLPALPLPPVPLGARGLQET